MGYLLLEGGAEFGGLMSEPDLRAIELAGGPDAPIAILPTAAALDNNHARAGRNGLRWFQSLGASRVNVVPVIDKASADDADLAAQIRSARFVYMLGGFPGFLGQTLRASRAWQAALEAFEQGAVIGGSSAGAMVLCEHYYDPEQGRLLPGLNLLPNACVLPHHNGFGKNWAGSLDKQLPAAVLIGIDEQTGIVDDGSGMWTVYGGGKITLYHIAAGSGVERARKITVHNSGETFRLAKR
jgi:cyanophycinase